MKSDVQCASCGLYWSRHLVTKAPFICPACKDPVERVALLNAVAPHAPNAAARGSGQSPVRFDPRPIQEAGP